MTVLSPLGETLNAEIELQDIGSLDMSALKAAVAPLSAFQQTNLELSPALRTVQLHVEQKNGKAFIKLSSTLPINAPFLDMLVQLEWPAGRLVREYTLLLDPPGYPKADDVTPVKLPTIADRLVAETAPEPLAQTAENKAAEPGEVAAAKPEVPAQPEVPAKPSVPAKLKEAPVATKPAPASKPAAATIKVKHGDTLYGLAGQAKTDEVSLEEMLVALYQANKQAFAGNNMNRLVAGKILTVPPAATAAAIGQTAASHEIRAHVAEWNAYRRKLAAAAAESKAGQMSPAQKTVSGKITTATDVAAPAAAKDVLKLSKSAAGKADGGYGLQEKIQALQEDAVAHEKTIKEANARIAELEKSIQDMRRLLEIKNKNLAALAQKPAAAPPAKPASEVKASEPAPKPQALEPAKPKLDTGKPKPEAAKAKPAPKQEQPELIDVLMGTPAYLGGAAAAILLLIVGLLAGLRKWRAKRAAHAASGPDTGEIGATGGLSTGGVVSTDTSFLTDFSRAGLGTIDTNEVDPIAEAEVYLAYGRDGQAEDILKEARVKEPQRYEIHQKLLEIYAARKSAKEFEAIASELYPTLEGQHSPMWSKVAKMGRDIDPANPLYGQPGGEAASELDMEKTLVLSAETAAAMRAAGTPPPLDFDLGEGEPETSEDLAPELDVDLNAPADNKQGAEEELPGDEGVIDFIIDEPSAEAEGSAASAAPTREEPVLDFDLGEAAGAEKPATATAELEPDESGFDDLLEMAEMDRPEEAAGIASVSEMQAAAPSEALLPVPPADAEAVLEFSPQAEETMPETAEKELDRIELTAAEEFSLPEPVEPEAEGAVTAEAAVAGEAAESLPSMADEFSLPEESPEAAEEIETIAAAALPEETPGIEEAAVPEEAGAISGETPPEAPLDFDFEIDAPTEETVSHDDETPMAVPDLDLSGLSLDLDETPAPSGGDAEIELTVPHGDVQWQESATKLDLARAYMEMGDREGAREILLEVAREGNAKQQEEANTLLAELG